MNTANTVIMILAAHVPMTVEQVDWNETELVLRGMGWNMSILTPWRILQNGKFVFGSDCAAVSEVASLLNGNSIIECKGQSSSAILDPALVLSSGHVLEIFSAAPLEPWTLFVRDFGRYVASPAE